MTTRIFCGEGDECSYSCPGYDHYGESKCRLVSEILKVQKAKVKAIEEGKVVEI